MSRFNFELGQAYTRSQIKQAIGLDPQAKGGPWDTGYAERDGADFIFCNVGVAGRTGHNYHNHFDGSDLLWYGKRHSHRGQQTIRRMTAPEAEVHVFWRANERAPFTYAGRGAAIDVSDGIPVKVRWRFQNSLTIASLKKSGRSRERLPAEVLNQVKVQHIREAARMLLEGHTDHRFAPSTDYDLVVEKGRRLPPKAVFGVAASLALGFEVLPKHFTAGTTSICFQTLTEAGYTVVRKGEVPLTSSPVQDTRDSAAVNTNLSATQTVADIATFNINSSAVTGNMERATRLIHLDDELEQARYFVAPDSDDGRERVLREVIQRRGQPAFRQALLDAYSGRCAVTGCDAVDALEAAHLIRYNGLTTQHVSNGILLRADVHTLFDLGLLSFCPDTLTVVLVGSLRKSSYADLHGRPLTLPLNPAMRPNHIALEHCWKSRSRRV